jgi:hypothetical protein
MTAIKFCTRIKGPEARYNDHGKKLRFCHFFTQSQSSSNPVCNPVCNPVYNPVEPHTLYNNNMYVGSQSNPVCNPVCNPDSKITYVAKTYMLVQIVIQSVIQLVIRIR